MLQNLYADGELRPEATIRKFLIVRTEGGRQVSRPIDHYNLDAILAVGYRVRSARGTQFRRWATERLAEYLVKGFTLDDERLKNPPVPGAGFADYFDELLERIRDIRASEKRTYLRVRESFALAADYQPDRDGAEGRPAQLIPRVAQAASSIDVSPLSPPPPASACPTPRSSSSLPSPSSEKNSSSPRRRSKIVS